MVRRRSADDYVDADSRCTTVQGLNVHYKRAGTGPVLLVLHGSGSSLHGFDSVAAFVAQHVERTATLTLVGPGGLEPKPPAGAGLLRHDRLGALLGRYLGNRMLEKHLSHNVRDAAQSSVPSMLRAAQMAATFGAFADRAGQRSRR